MIMALGLKRFVKSLIPAPILNRRRAATINRMERAQAGETLQETFSNIYAHEWWGQSATGFYSGIGSHEEAIVGPYVKAVRSFGSGSV